MPRWSPGIHHVEVHPGQKGQQRARLAGSHLDLLAAVRLLDNAFKENADTEVVTDILFMRERETGFFEQEYRTASVNRYFLDNPDMILGTQSMNGTMYRSDGYTVEPDGRDLGEAIREALCAALPVRTWDQPVALTEQPRPAEITLSLATTNPAETKRVEGLKEIYLAAKHLLGAETEGANGADLRQTTFSWKDTSDSSE